jgi:hypothetical protein
MQTPSFMNGDSPKRLFQGLIAGAVGAIVIGFGWGGWHLGSTVEKQVASASETAMVSALAPICADKFERAANGDEGLVGKLKAVSAWERDSHLMKTGWATFPGGAEPDDKVAEACASLLNASFKL